MLSCEEMETVDPSTLTVPNATQHVPSVMP